jgi:hypothetical protein
MYRGEAKRRGIAFRLPFKLFCSYWQAPCWYCGYGIRTIGLDRIDSDKGYLPSNVRPCCSLCNRAKSDMSEVQFLALCANVVRRHGLVYGRV